MSLKLLAGPFPITHGETGEVAINCSDLFWHPDLGIIATVSYQTLGNLKSLIAIDGVATQQGGDGNETLSVPGWWVSARRMVRFKSADSSEWAYDNRALTRQIMVEVNDDGWNTSLLTNGYVRLSGPTRWVIYSPTTGVNILDKNAGVLYASGSGINGIFHHHVGPGRSDTEIFIGETLVIGNPGSGIAFFDLKTQEVTMTGFLAEKHSSVVYATDYGVLVSMHVISGSAYLYVWALEKIPVAVSAPTLIAGEATEGKIATYRVQVTGDFGEVVEHELVNWTVTGVGTMVDAQSETDEDGYAIARVRYGVGDVGDSTVRGTVRC